MGRCLSQKIKVLTEKEYNDLKSEFYYINPDDLELINEFEVTKKRKALYFDIIEEMIERGDVQILQKTNEKTSLYQWFEELAEKFELNDFDAYVDAQYEIPVTLEQWLNDEELNNGDIWITREIQDYIAPDGSKYYILMEAYCRIN